MTANGHYFERLYQPLIRHHFAENRQMLFLMGPRQVGKTTTARQTSATIGRASYLSWDQPDDRRDLIAGPTAIAARVGTDRLEERAPVCVLDELHKYAHWKDLLKSLFDTHGERARFLVTGSARLDVFRSGGDSLMGRYFPYRMHPLSLGELARPELDERLIRQPRPVPDDLFDAWLRFGCFPEPLWKANQRFWRRWSRTRRGQLLREDVRDLTRTRELGQVEVLAELIRQQAGQLSSYASLSRRLGASMDSVRRWLAILESLYFCFSLRPWHRNVARSLRKEPKYFLWDASQAVDVGAKAENLVACALLKAVHLWTDRGEGEFALHFLRDKQKHEVDFLVVRDGAPWFLVEVKQGGAAHLSPDLARFQRQTGAMHAFQVGLDLPYVERDCFAETGPVIVPARTLLAQLP